MWLVLKGLDLRNLHPKEKKQREREREKKEVIRCPIWIQSHLGQDKNRSKVTGQRHTSLSPTEVLWGSAVLVHHLSLMLTHSFVLMLK